MSNMATSLIINDSKSITTTLAKAKELRPYIEKLITRAKKSFIRERNGEFPQGHVDVHSRREAAKLIKDKKALQALFDEIAPAVLEREGGYTRIIKLGQRRGDGAEEAIIQLVDWSAKQDGAVSMNDKKKKVSARKPAAPKAAKIEAPVAEASAVVAEVAEAPAEESAVFEDTAETAEPTAAEVDGASVAETETATDESAAPEEQA